VTSVRHTLSDLEDLPIPTIAAVEGYALGGGLEVSDFFSGGIRAKIETCSYFVTFEYERSSYFLIWAATKKITAGGGTSVRPKGGGQRCGAGDAGGSAGHYTRSGRDPAPAPSHRARQSKGAHFHM
jgi:hypothetical protein